MPVCDTVMTKRFCCFCAMQTTSQQGSAMSCLHNCSSHGTCSFGICRCDPPFLAADCSYYPTPAFNQAFQASRWTVFAVSLSLAVVMCWRLPLVIMLKRKNVGFTWKQLLVDS